ncbi:OmpA family protein [Nocardiopsis sp. JB363]|uniref:OmpA family protein n=1 Tax=Nocardiopsis sp. JB363 TaxID=1434837 RepID=UPI00135B0329|nr:OmpA family protein [Nocardiopsis sp. JB363]
MFVALLWAVWAAYLVIIVLDILALLRGLVPRVGLVRLVWVLATGGATAASTHTAAVAAHTDAAVEAPAHSVPGGQEEPTSEDRGQEEEERVIERARNLSGFSFDSADLTSGMRDSLEPTLGMINDFNLADAPVVVTGHTDPVGDPGYNQGLSERRAQAVADYLAEHLEEPVEFEVVGAGSAQPPTEPGASYAEHRRVEIAYTLQPPSVEEPGAEEKAEGQGKAAEETSEPLPEQVQLDVSTASDHDRPSPLLVGAAAGAAGVGVGYAAGRRHAHTRGTRSGTKAPESGEAPGQCEDGSAETDDGIDPPGDELVRGDLGGAENGIIDSDGYMLVGQTARVDARQGVAFIGAHAAEVLAAVVTGHEGQGPVVATRAAVEALGDIDALTSGVRIVADLPGVRLAVETALLTRQRQSMDDELGADEASGPGAPCSLVVCTATEARDALEADQVLRDTPGVVVGVLGELQGLGAMVHCEDLEQARVTSEGGQTFEVGLLRHRVRPGGHSAQDEGETCVSEPADPQPEPEFAPEPEPETEAVSAPEPVAQPAPAPEETDSSTHPPSVRVRLFAPQPVCEAGGRDALARSSSRLLLAMLALSPRGLSESQIDEVLASGKDESKARKDRYNAITSLRAPLREALKSEDDILFKENGRYVLQEGLFDIDVWHTNELRQRVNLAEEDREALLRELVSFWEKPLLSDCEEEWFAPYRKHYSDQFVEVLVLLAKEAESAESRVFYLKKAMELDRFNESIYQDVMCVYGGMGRPDAVRRTYRSLETALSELKKKPSPVSEQLLDGLTHPEAQSQG